MTSSEKVCVVTGGSAGIGLATCQGLLEAKCKVLFTCSSRESGQIATEQLQQCVQGCDPVPLPVDLRSLEDSARVADSILRHCPAIDVLILNAGIAAPTFALTDDGVEQTFAINHLSQFLLLQRLLPALRRGAQARVIFVASQIHADRFQQKFQSGLDDYNGDRVYRETKLANILTAFELARRLEGSNMTANALHPGVVETGLLANLRSSAPPNGPARSGPAKLRAGLATLLRPREMYRRIRLLAGTPPAGPQRHTPAQAAATTLYLALDPAVEGVSGAYFKDQQVQPAKPVCSDAQLARELWSYSLGLIAAVP